MSEFVVTTVRRVVAELRSGEPLLPALDALCIRHEVIDGTLTLRGRARDVCLDLEDDQTFDITGTSTLIAATGRIGADLGLTDLYATVAWVDRGIPRSVSGRIVAGEALSIDVFVDAFLDAVESTSSGSGRSPATSPRGPADRPSPRTTPHAPRALPAAVEPKRREPTRDPREPTLDPREPKLDLREPKLDLGEPKLDRPAQAPTSSPTAALPSASPVPAVSAPGWGQAVKASQTAAAFRPSSGAGRGSSGGGTAAPGDLLIHPQFGRCKVVKSDEGDKVKIRLPAGRFTDLHLKFITLERQADEDGTRVFRVQIGKP